MKNQTNSPPQLRYDLDKILAEWWTLTEEQKEDRAKDAVMQACLNHPQFFENDH